MRRLSPGRGNNERDAHRAFETSQQGETQMTGHVRRRGKKSFELKFDAGNDPVTGRRRVRYVSFKGTKHDAEIELARLVSENASGAGIDPSKATLAEFLDRWDRDWAISNVEGKTIERYRELIALYIKPHLGAVRIQKLRPLHLNELYAKLQREGGKGGRALAPRTVGHVHRLLHRALGHAATWASSFRTWRQLSILRRCRMLS